MCRIRYRLTSWFRHHSLQNNNHRSLQSSSRRSSRSSSHPRSRSSNRPYQHSSILLCRRSSSHLYLRSSIHPDHQNSSHPLLKTCSRRSKHTTCRLRGHNGPSGRLPRCYPISWGRTSCSPAYWAWLCACWIPQERVDVLYPTSHPGGRGTARQNRVRGEGWREWRYWGMWRLHTMAEVGHRRLRV